MFKSGVISKENLIKLRRKFLNSKIGSGKWDRTTDLGLMSPAL